MKYRPARTSRLVACQYWISRPVNYLHWVSGPHPLIVLSWIYHFVADCEEHQLAYRVESEFEHDLSPVRFDCSGTDR
jgi:hypothetical protein